MSCQSASGDLFWWAGFRDKAVSVNPAWGPNSLANTHLKLIEHTYFYIHIQSGVIRSVHHWVQFSKQIAGLFIFQVRIWHLHCISHFFLSDASSIIALPCQLVTPRFETWLMWPWHMINATFQSHAITSCLTLQNLAKPNTLLNFGLFEAEFFPKNIELCCWCQNKTLQKSRWCRNKTEAMLLLPKQNKGHVVKTKHKPCSWCLNNTKVMLMMSEQKLFYHGVTKSGLTNFSP